MEDVFIDAPSSSYIESGADSHVGERGGEPVRTLSGGGLLGAYESAALSGGGVYGRKVESALPLSALLALAGG